MTPSATPGHCSRTVSSLEGRMLRMLDTGVYNSSSLSSLGVGVSSITRLVVLFLDPDLYPLLDLQSHEREKCPSCPQALHMRPSAGQSPSAWL